MAVEAGVEAAGQAHRKFRISMATMMGRRTGASAFSPIQLAIKAEEQKELAHLQSTPLSHQNRSAGPVTQSNADLGAVTCRKGVDVTPIERPVPKFLQQYAHLLEKGDKKRPRPVLHEDEGESDDEQAVRRPVLAHF